MKMHVRFAALFTAAFALLASIAPSAAAATGDELTGRASVIDGDTIEIRGQRIRLHGIDAPESDQFCEDAAGVRYRCGQQAAFFLSDMLGIRNVTCVELDIDRYDRVIGRCTFTHHSAGTVDANAAMVDAGHAVAYRRFSRDYVSQERAAKAAKRGMWAGSFTMPWDWRRR